MPTNWLTTSVSHSVPARFNPKGNAYSTQRADPEPLGRTHGSNHSIAPLLLADPRHHAQSAMNSTPIVRPSV